jgi:hypothetical protein
MKSESLECLSPEAISNRFQNANAAYDKWFMEKILKTDPWWVVWTKEMREDHIKKLMEQKGLSRTKALKIVKAEEKKQKKEYDSPLAVANRKIVQLESRLETIREFVNDPNYLDRYDT